MPSYTFVKPRRRTKSRRKRNTLSIGVHRARGYTISRTSGRIVPPGGYVSDRAGGKPLKRRAKRRKNPGGRRRRIGARRRRNVRGQIRRGSRGRFVRKGGRLLARLPKRRRNPGRSLSRRRRRRNRPSFSIRRRRRRSNPGYAVRRRRRRNRPSFSIRRRRRRNPGGRMRIFRRRRNRGFMRRRNPGVFGMIRDVFSVNTASQVVAGTVGLSASLWGPKLAGHLIWAPLGRGWGGVVTSLVSVGIVSKLTSYVSYEAGKASWLGGLIGVVASALSALHCGIRMQVLPFESSLVACALPTNPNTVSPGQGMIQQLIAGGVPPAAAMAQVRALGLSDYVQAQNGMRGYGGGNAPGMERLLSGEQSFRRAAGVSDYANFQRSGSSAGMDASPESF